MGRILCVTGTGTEIGKTAFSLALLLWAREEGLRAGSVKVVQCGSRLPDSEPFQGDAEWIEAAVPETFETSSIYNFPDPVSPHLAAERAGAWIDPDWILDKVTAEARRFDFLVVEGAGGAATPLARDGLSLSDLAARGEWPCLILCPPGLGTLHQTRAAAQFLASRGAPLAGFAMSQTDPNPVELFPDNRDTLAALLEAPFLGMLPFCPGLHKRLPLPPAMASLLARAVADGIPKSAPA
jgi:dethiobiotin synthetase